jgi:DHA1 family multidrug resistance protein-like MFS transporter
VAAVSAIIPSVAQTFKTNEFFVGKIVWLYMLPYGLAALIYGPLARNVESKKILFSCIALFSVANLITGLAPNLFILFAARVFAGISGAAIVPLSLILIAQSSTFKQRGRRVGGFFSLTFTSSLLGLFLSGLIFWRWIFLLPAIGAVLVCTGIYFCFPQLNTANEKIRFQYLQVLKDRQVFRLFVYIFFISFIYHGIRQWLGVYYSQIYGLEQFFISMLLTTISLSGIFGESLGGIFADRFGRLKIINIGIGLMLASVIMLLFKHVLASLFIIMFVWGLGWTFNHSGVSTFLTDLPRRHLYESASLNSTVRFLSGGLGASLGGVLAQKSFSLEFIIFIFCLLILLVFSKKFIV